MKIKANYKTHPVDAYNENPLTEVIRVYLDDETIRQKLTIKPNIQDDLWQLPPVYQKGVLRKLTELHIPAPKIFELYEKFVILTLESYALNNPMSADTVRLQMEAATSAKNDQMMSSSISSRTTAPSVLVYGHSGTGKTTLIRQALSLMPQVVEHDSYNGKVFKQEQLVWLSFDLPSTASTKGLALNFFQAVDEALGTEYYLHWKDKSHRTVERHLGEIQVIALTHHIGIVHIDELQFMLKYGKAKSAPSFTTIEALFNKLGIPIVLSSTTAGRDIFLSGQNSPDFTTIRRLLTDREYMVPTYSLKGSFFRPLFNELFSKVVCTDHGIPDESFITQFHHHTCGLPAMMIRLACLHHETIVSMRKKDSKNMEHYQTNDSALLDAVFKDQFSLISNSLDKLRSGNVNGFEKDIAETNSSDSCFTNSEISKAREESRIKASKDIEIDNTTPLGIPTVIPSTETSEEVDGYNQQGALNA